jgi:hypothetical protein
MPFSSIPRRLAATVRQQLRNYTLPATAKEERRRDHRGLPSRDPGAAATIDGALAWLCVAQDRSRSHDGGVARDYSLIDGWASSYPETTGYIIPTFLACATDRDPRGLRERARRMLDWLAGIQLPSGAFQAGKIEAKPAVPVTFNTGQILLGLAAGETAFGDYARELQSTADWLVATQDPDGCWRRFPTPFAIAGEKTYETHVAWGLLEAARVYPNRGYAEAALRNIRWAIGKQKDNGWLADCCLADAARPLTHTLGYALRGLIEGHRFSADNGILNAARRLADGLLPALRDDGYLPGRMNSDWSPAVSWVCLTGTVQLAHCWLSLYVQTRDERYLSAGRRANAFVRRCVPLDGPEGICGGVKGSFPIDGDYCQFQYINWGPKFLIDSLLLEREITSADEAGNLAHPHGLRHKGTERLVVS